MEDWRGRWGWLSRTPTEGELPDWLAYDKEMRDGATVVDDGVAVSSGPVVAGMCVVNVPDVNAATAWAEKIPTARYGSVDVRPVVEYEG